MRLCTYIIKHDHGLAPNPFGEWCTLAVCTPNHQGAKLAEGDWIAGFTTKSKSYRLIYAMMVDEHIHMAAYFSDPRFAYKRPVSTDPARQRCGDNFYELLPNGGWHQHPNVYHRGDAYLRKDTRHPYVFAGRRFWYFGGNAVLVPKEISLKVGGKGIRVNHPGRSAEQFLTWLQANHPPGVHGAPTDNPRAGSQAEFFINPARRLG